MPKSGDIVKREEWRRRLDRFEAGNLSVAQFCQEEGVGTHTFYYWRTQLGRKSARGRRSRVTGNRRSRRLKQRAAVPWTPNEAGTTQPDLPPTSERVIHFAWDSRLSFSIPADCLSALRCVLEYASSARAEPRDVRAMANAFQQVIVD